jgi:hypothetical protein
MSIASIYELQHGVAGRRGVIWRPKRCRREAPTREVIRPDGDPTVGRFYAAIPRLLSDPVLEVTDRLWWMGAAILPFANCYEVRLTCPWCQTGTLAVLELASNGVLLVVECQCESWMYRTILCGVPAMVVRINRRH